MKNIHISLRSASLLHPSSHLPATSRLPLDSYTPASLPLISWWLWPNLLSIDAPLISLIWAILFCRAAKVSLHPSTCLALTFSVWAIYLCDRLLDTTASAPHSSARHRFVRAHRTQLLASLFAAIFLIFLALSFLPRQQIFSGLLLGALVLVYLYAVHASARRLTAFFPKELAVGFLFAAGTALPLWSQNPSHSFLAVAPIFLLAALCSLNCLAIEYWENLHASTLPSSSAFIRATGPRIDFLAVALAAISALSAIALPASPPFPLLAITIAALLFIALNKFRSRLSTPLSCVLADALLFVAAAIALALQFA